MTEKETIIREYKKLRKANLETKGKKQEKKMKISMKIKMKIKMKS